MLVFCHEHSHEHHGHSHEHHGHSHEHHGHSHEEPPSFKYSKSANKESSHEHRGHSHEQDHAHEPHHGHSHDHHGHSHEEPPASHDSKSSNLKNKEGGKEDDIFKEKGIKVPEFNLWVTAVGSTVLISLAPIVMLFLIPLDKSPSHENFLKTLLSFASGGLLGDAFLHLIPHALSAHGDQEGHNHAHSHSHSDGEPHSHNMGVGLWILAGIVAFLAVEKVVRLLKNDSGHGHSHSVAKKEEQHGDSVTKKNKDKAEGKLKDTKKGYIIKKFPYSWLKHSCYHHIIIHSYDFYLILFWVEFCRGY